MEALDSHYRKPTMRTSTTTKLIRHSKHHRSDEHDQFQELKKATQLKLKLASNMETSVLSGFVRM